MAWEKRGSSNSGRQYYYTAKKVNGHTVKTYHTARFGWAKAMSDLDVLDRQEAQRDRQMQRDERAAWDEIDRVVRAVYDNIGNLVADALTEAGYHRHDRGAWRKKRMTDQKTTTLTATALRSEMTPGAEALAVAANLPETIEERQSLVLSGGV